jgi:cytochrome c-type biogenesis protein CcmH
MSSSLNKNLKRWPGWLLLAAVVVVALAFGSTRSSGPLTDSDRIDSISQRLACPTCEGESVYESQASAARGIKQQIKRFVEQGTSTDDQIIQYVQSQFGAKTLLVPKATGLDALVWALPAFALVIAVFGLVVAFRRWKSAADTVPTDDDRALVNAALQQELHDGS